MAKLGLNKVFIHKTLQNKLILEELKDCECVTAGSAWHEASEEFSAKTRKYSLDNLGVNLFLQA